MKHLVRNHPLLAIRNELNRALGGFPHLFESRSFPEEAFEELCLCPSMDVVEDDSNFKVELEMPGMGEADIKVSIDDGVLNIKGEKKTSRQDQGKNYVRREIGYGSYERSISLPETVDIDQAKASFKKGMLWVTMPKKAGTHSQKRELKIERISS